MSKVQTSKLWRETEWGPTVQAGKRSALTVKGSEVDPWQSVSLHTVGTCEKAVFACLATDETAFLVRFGRIAAQILKMRHLYQRVAMITQEISYSLTMRHLYCLTCTSKSTIKQSAIEIQPPKMCVLFNNHPFQRGLLLGDNTPKTPA